MLNRNLCYKILGLDTTKTASINEIKRAYREMALHTHPDKLKSDCTANEFIKMKEAYEYLLKHNESEFYYDATDIASYIKLFEKLCKSIQFLFKDDVTVTDPQEQFYEANEDFDDVQHKRSDIILNIKVTLAELYNEPGKKLVVRYNTNNNESATHGVYLTFVDYKKVSTFSGKGDWNKINQTYDDLIVNIDVVSDSQCCMINEILDDYELLRVIDISLYEYYYGYKETINHFGTEVYIEHKPFDNGTQLVISGYGLKCWNERDEIVQGNLCILFKVNYKNQSFDESDQELKNMLSKYFSCVK